MLFTKISYKIDEVWNDPPIFDFLIFVDLVSLLKKKKYACKEKYNLLGTTTTLHVGRHAKNINYYLKHFVDTPCTIYYTRTTQFLRGYDPFLRCHTASNHTTYTTRNKIRLTQKSSDKVSFMYRNFIGGTPALYFLLLILASHHSSLDAASPQVKYECFTISFLS